MRIAPSLPILALALALAPALGGCHSPKIDNVVAFRAARRAGDLETARSYLTDDPRVWYGKRSGYGLEWTLGAGRWKAWDEHFNSISDLGPWNVEGKSVWAVATEMNDYYRLIERATISRYRITYFFDDDDLIEGYMISDTDPANPDPPSVSRFDEFEAWARVNHPEEWAYLRPGGKLDPTGDRAPRTRALLDEWRHEVGLPGG